MDSHKALVFITKSTFIIHVAQLKMTSSMQIELALIQNTMKTLTQEAASLGHLLNVLDQ